MRTFEANCVRVNDNSKAIIHFDHIKGRKDNVTCTLIQPIR